MSKKVIDYSAGNPSATAIKNGGYKGVMRYVSPARASWMTGKPATKAQVDDYKKHNLKFAFVWQYGAGSVGESDVMRGRDGGLQDARAAQKQLEAIGAPDHPVFFAVDFDITLRQWNGTAVHYFRAACEVLGRERVGIYGHSRVCHWAMEDNVVAPVAQGRVLAWVTRSWKFDEGARNYCVLYQNVHNVNRLGIQVDENEVLHNEWGWRKPANYASNATPTQNNGGARKVSGIKPNHNHRGDPLFLPELLRAWGITVKEMPGWRNWGTGDFGEIRGVMAHHTAGSNTSAEFIARNPLLQNKLSSQIHLGRDGVATICGAGIAWHAGRGRHGNWVPENMGNQYLIGIEAVNRGDGSQPWTAVQMDAYKKICAAICWYLGLPASRVIGHKEYSYEGKIDPNFDMHAFRADVQKLIDNPPIENTGEITVSQADRIIKHMTDYTKGYLGPVITDVKDIREQLTGSRNVVYRQDGSVDLEKSYRGWKNILGVDANGKGLTVVDSIGALRKDVHQLRGEINELKKRG